MIPTQDEQARNLAFEVATKSSECCPGASYTITHALASGADLRDCGDAVWEILEHAEATRDRDLRHACMAFFDEMRKREAACPRS
jgi:hypothetical protein